MGEEQSADPQPLLGLEIQEEEIVFSVGNQLFWIPRNSLTVLLTQIVMFLVVVVQINRTLRRACGRVIGIIDDCFEVLDFALTRTKAFFTSENTENVLSNVQKILVIILITLIILDLLGVVSLTVPKWVFAF